MKDTKKNHAPRLLLLAVVAALLVGGAVAMSGCSKTATSSQPAAGGTTQPSSGAASSAPTVTKLTVKDLKVGTGTTAKPGDVVTVHYTGWLLDGTKFESSYDSNQPFTFQLGVGQVIPGWDQGVVGMKVGGTRELVIPSDLAYGSQGSPPKIPPDAPLKFDVVLLKVQPAK